MDILHPRMFCSKFGWNWPIGSGEEDLKIYFHSFVIISLWKRMRSLFEKTWIPFIKGCFVPSLVEIGPVVLEKKKKMWKVYNNDHEDGQQTNCDQKSSLDPLAQVSLKLKAVFQIILMTSSQIRGNILCDTFNTDNWPVNRVYGL